MGFATDAIDRLHTTAEAHRRIMVVEVMGRYAGWIALHAGVAGGADAILIPEIPFDSRARGRAPAGARRVGRPIQHRRRRGRRVSEGRDSWRCSRRRTTGTSSGWAAWARQVCEALARLTGKETRSVVLGHLQRGGAPTSFDRVLATRFGGKAVELIQKGEFGKMVAFAPPDIVARPLDEVVGKTKTVPLDFDLLLTARALGRDVRRLSAQPEARPSAVPSRSCVFLLLQLVDQLDVIVGDLLDLVEALPLVVFRNLVILQQLLEPVVGVAAHLADDVASFLGLLVHVP